MKKTTRLNLLLSGVFFALSAALWIWMKNGGDGKLREIGKTVRAIISGAFSPLRSPVAEWVILAGPVILLIMLIVRTVKKGWQGFMSAISTVLIIASVCCPILITTLAVNYTGPSLADEMGLELSQYSAEQLAEVTSWLKDQLNTYAPMVDRDENGVCLRQDFNSYAVRVIDNYEALGKDLSRFSERVIPPKQTSLMGILMSYFSISGFYFPLTVEGVCSSDVVPANMIFNAAHETAHVYGIGSEAEANFAAFLCCMQSDDINMRYSGVMNGYIYASNALFRTDSAKATEILYQICDEAQNDLNYLSKHLEKYETPVKEVGQAVNDSFIVATGQPAGLQSYGMMVDLLIAWRLENK